jgi:hypothetical protein
MRFTIALLLLAAVPEFAGPETKKPSDGAEPGRPLPLFFIPNAGQMGATIRYAVQTPELQAGFGADFAVFQVRSTRFEVRFGGANANVQPGGEELLEGRANFLTGDQASQWKTGLPIYGMIRYRNLYPGIDATYSGSGSRVKSKFLVAPGGSPASIRLEYAEGVALSVDAAGNLVASQGGEHLREQAPVVYQVAGDGGRTAVDGRYRLLGEHSVGFEVGAYDGTRELVIDPVITYSTYLGGSLLGAVTAVAIDGSGNLYAAGWTEALDFPIAGAVQAANQGGVDAFVVKLNAAGTSLLYATYIGGSGDDRAAGIAVDSFDQAYVVGATASPNFPVAAPAQATLHGGKDAFALKLNAVGNLLLYSTYLGGTNTDSGTAVAVDASGNAYVAGDTLSANFPVSNAVQSTFGGATDAFIVKLTAAGAISYSTFLGGSAAEHSGGIAVDSSGNVYVAGGTFSTNFPVAAALQPANAGGQDAFVTKLNAAGSQILYSTYLGGSGGSASAAEQANAVAVDSGNNVYVTGVTSSGNFPVTPSALQTSFGGVLDAFVAKLNAAGSALVYSSYLGGSSFDWGTGVAVDPGGNAYVAGYTSSVNFPTSNGVQAGFNGLYDAFVAEVNATGNGLTFSTYFGGSGSDVANAIAVDTSGDMFIGGQTNSLDLPLKGPLQPANVGGSTGWLARLGASSAPPQIPAVASVSPASGSGNSVTFTAQYSDPGGGASLATVSVLVNSSAATDYGCYISYSPSSGRFTLANDVASSGGTTVTPGGGTVQNSQCTLNGAVSSVSLSGNSLSITVALTFLPSFAGNKTVYLYAADANANTGWVSKGSWNVLIPLPQPSVDSVSPNSGLGASQTFTFVYSDTQNVANMTGLGMLFSSSPPTFTNACYLFYDGTAGELGLYFDNMQGQFDRSLNSQTVLQNSQCAVGASTFTISGLTMTISLNITFKAPFDGPTNIYMYASDYAYGVNTGWVLKGTFTAAAPANPTISGVVPASGSGPAQRFTFTASNPGGATLINNVSVLFASTFNLVSACYLVWDGTALTESLGYENPANGATPGTLGSNVIISNNQCNLRLVNSTIAYAGNTVTLTLDLTFDGSFAGVKNVYVSAGQTGYNSGWVTAGTWTVTGGSPTADSVSPSSGAGSTNRFTFQGSDSAEQTNITGMTMLLTAGAPGNTANACYLVYDRYGDPAGGTIGLYNDAGTALVGKKYIGYSTLLQNSQCSVGYTLMTVTSGTSIQFLLELFFKTPAFDGPKTVYLQTNEATGNSGMVSRGAWTVQ